MKKLSLRFLFKFVGASLLLLGSTINSTAQTNIHISGAQTGFPIAIPVFCSKGGAEEPAKKMSALISKDLDLSGVFKVLPQSGYVSNAGKCLDTGAINYPDWTVIGAEGLVYAALTVNGNRLVAEMYLYDVAQQKSKLAKKYEGTLSDASRIAHKFANEIILVFTGELGIFGTRIAYVGKVGRFKELFVSDLDGENRKQLTNEKGLALSPSWGPGDNLVYTSFRSRQPEINIISATTGATKQITKRPGHELSPKFMADGNILASASNSSGNSNLVIFDLRGAIIKKVTSGDAIDVSPSISPDGRSIVYCSNKSGGPQIYLKDINGGSEKRISFTGSNYCTSPHFSPKGDKIAFVCRQAGLQIFAANVDGSNPVQLTFGGDNEDPVWSKDGRYLLFSSNFGGGVKNLAFMPLVSGELKKLISSSAELTQPSWSYRSDS